MSARLKRIIKKKQTARFIHKQDEGEEVFSL
jgi:hypothetical protein